MPHRSSTSTDDSDFARVGHRAGLEAIRGAGFALRESWKVRPVLMLGAIGISGALAALPAMQIIAIDKLAMSITEHRDTLVPLIVLSTTICIGQSARMLSTLTSERLALAQEIHQQKKLLAALTRMSPQKLSTPETNARVQASRNAIVGVSRHVFSVLHCLQSFLAALGVCAAIWRLNVLASILVLLALVPLLVQGLWSATQQDRAWELIGEQQRHVGYAVEQLVSQRTGTELATLGTGSQIADIATRHQRQYAHLMVKLYNKLTVAQLGGALTTAALLAGALAALINADAGTAGVAAGVVGVISGMNAMSDAGWAL